MDTVPSDKSQNPSGGRVLRSEDRRLGSPGYLVGGPRGWELGVPLLAQSTPPGRGRRGGPGPSEWRGTADTGRRWAASSGRPGLGVLRVDSTGWRRLLATSAGGWRPAPVPVLCAPRSPQLLPRRPPPLALEGSSLPRPARGPTAADPHPAGSYWTTKRDGEVRLRLGRNSSDHETPLTVHDMVMHSATRYASYIALGTKRKDRWHLLTYIQYYELCRRAAKAFLKVPRRQPAPAPRQTLLRLRAVPRPFRTSPAPAHFSGFAFLRLRGLLFSGLPFTLRRRTRLGAPARRSSFPAIPLAYAPAHRYFLTALRIPSLLYGL